MVEYWSSKVSEKNTNATLHRVNFFNEIYITAFKVAIKNQNDMTVDFLYFSLLDSKEIEVEISVW